MQLYTRLGELFRRGFSSESSGPQKSKQLLAGWLLTQSLTTSTSQQSFANQIVCITAYRALIMVKAGFHQYLGSAGLQQLFLVQWHSCHPWHDAVLGCSTLVAVSFGISCERCTHPLRRFQELLSQGVQAQQWCKQEGSRWAFIYHRPAISADTIRVCSSPSSRSRQQIGFLAF